MALLKFRAKYTSATIQNELISIIGEQLGESIVCQIPGNTPFYLILADEVTDVANKEQLSLAVFVDIREVKFDVYGKRQTEKIKLLPSVFSSLYSRIKIFVLAMNSKRHFSIFV